MGIKLGDDIIGNLSHAGGNIILQPSLLTLGGQQFRTPLLNFVLPTLLQNTLYFVYARRIATVISLDVVQTVPSVYRVSNLTAKLVGAFYSNGSGSPVFGGFVNIEGKPTSELFFSGLVPIKVGLSGNFNKANVVVDTSDTYRDGEFAVTRYRFQMGAGTQDNGTNVIGPLPNLDIDFVKYETTGAGTVNSVDGGYVSSSGLGKTHTFAPSISNNGFILVFDQPSGSNNFSAFANQPNSISWVFSGRVRYPIVGWSNTPLVEL